MVLSDEDIEYIQWAKSVFDRSHFPQTEKITEVYNRVYSDRKNFRPIANTNCGSCLRTRVLQMHRDLMIFLRENPLFQ